MTAFLADNNPGRKALLLGNEAIVRGALEAGVEVATAYPGTPSTEIADAFYNISKNSELYFEYGVNEKVALEVGAGASWAGMRTICCMKHVGLNVAADPLSSLAYSGVKGGYVIVTADEPSMHSSQNEQDNRQYARLTLLPTVDPANPAEAMEVMKKSFVLSEELGLPVLFRTTTRVSHTRGVCEFGELTPRRFNAELERGVARFTPLPPIARKLRLAQLEKQAVAAQIMARLGFDRIEGQGELGIITSGVAYCYVKEVLRDLGMEEAVKVLKVVSINPTPQVLIEEMLDSCRRIMVVEELEPFVETDVRVLAQKRGANVEIVGKGEEWIPRYYELSPERILEPIARFVGEDAPSRRHVDVPELPSRPPMLCAGCSHRSSYYAVRSVVDEKAVFYSDIGCYTLGYGSPLNTCDAFLCMGSGLTLAGGAGVNNSQKNVAFIGDSTFYHSGMAGLANAVHNKHDLLLVILDNSTTAMTGHQPLPTSDFDENTMRPLSIDAAVRGLGVADVNVVDPHDLKHTMQVVHDAYRRKGVRVVISRKPCALFERRILGKPAEKIVYTTNHDACKFCGKNDCHQPCSVDTIIDDEAFRAKTKIMVSNVVATGYSSIKTETKPAAAPCTFTCPSNICVLGYLSLARAGCFTEALSMIREAVPLPGVLGRVCHHPCESACVRGDYDEPIAVNEIKRFLAENETSEERAAYIEALKQDVAAAQAINGAKKVAVIGSGPAGLTAAFDLARAGFQVTIFERETVAGGLLATGIPPYRLPRHLLQTELETMFALEIRLELGVALGRDITLDGLLNEGFDAICLATGAHKSMMLSLEGEENECVEGALKFLRRVFVEDEKTVGDVVAVVGGGDAALDAARTALRLGAKKVSILYRRTADEMPAAPEEIEAALKEGVEFIYTAMPSGLDFENDRLVSVSCVRTEPGPADESGRRRPVVVAGSEFQIAVEHLIVAIGQSVEESTLHGEVAIGIDSSGIVQIDKDTCQTSHPRIFAAGDMTGGDWTVIAAIADGRRAAASIESLLEGEKLSPLELRSPEALTEHHRYHPPVVNPLSRPKLWERDGRARASDFGHMTDTLSAEQVVKEAERCLTCGQCARCNNCIDNFGCPAIYKVDGKIYIDEVTCVGCGVCARLCPNDAIVPVPVAAV